MKNWIPISSSIILVSIFVYSVSRGSTDVIFLGLTIKGEVFLGLTTGIITSVTGSIFFLIFLYSLKPNIVISENIGYDHKKEKYLFKVINKSYLFSANDLDIRLYKMTPLGVSKGNNWRLEKRKINDGDIALINSKRQGKKYASYAIVFATDENIKDLIEEESTNIMFQISLKHSFSGFTKTYRAPLIIQCELRYWTKSPRTRHPVKLIANVMSKQGNAVIGDFGRNPYGHGSFCPLTVFWFT